MTLMSLKTGVNTMKCSEDLKHFMSLQKHAQQSKTTPPQHHDSILCTPFLNLPPDSRFFSFVFCSVRSFLWSSIRPGAYGGKEWMDNSLLLSLWSSPPLSRPISSFTSEVFFCVFHWIWSPEKSQGFKKHTF